MQGRPFLGKRSSLSNFPNTQNKYGRDEEEQFYGITGDDIQDKRMGRRSTVATPNRLENIGMSQAMAPNSYLPRRSAYFESHWPLYSAHWVDDKVAVGTFSEDQSSRVS